MTAASARALRGIAISRKAWLFAGSDRGGEQAAATYTLIVTAKMNGLDPRAWSNFSAHCHVLSWLTMVPRAASKSSTMRKLSGKRK